MSKPKAYVEKNTEGKIRLHANESPYNNLPILLSKLESQLSHLNINEYPSLNAVSLKKEFGSKLHVDPSSLILGNGSDELISLVIQSVCNPNDVIVTHTPSFSQYTWSAALHHCQLVEVKDQPGFIIDCEGLIKATHDNQAKLLILCTPNNPTGALISKADMEKIVKETSCFILIDEAYYDFVDQDFKELVLSSSRIITLRTFSKAYGCAGLRFGYGIAQPHIIDMLNQKRQPYNVSSLSQMMAQQMIHETNLVQAQVKQMLEDKLRIIEALNSLNCTIAPSMANFIFFSHPQIEKLENILFDAGFAIKSFTHHPHTLNYARMSIPNSYDTQTLLRVLKGVNL